MQESVIYQKILTLGEQREDASLIIRQLSRRFGTVEGALQKRIRQISVSQLEKRGENLLDFSSLIDLFD